MAVVEHRSFSRFLLAATVAVSCGGGNEPSVQPVEGPGLTGVLETEAGEALADTTVMACMLTTCLFSETSQDGRFTFAIEAPAEVAFKTHSDLARMPRLGATLHPVRVLGDAIVDLESVYVPSLPVGVRLGPARDDPQTLLVGDELELILNRGDLVPSLGEVLIDVAARLIPNARAPRLPDLGAEQVVAMYALHPFAAKSHSPIAVRAPASLPSGTRVSFRTISEIDGTLSAPVQGTANGSVVSTDPGAGILALTWLVISR